MGMRNLSLCLFLVTSLACSGTSKQHGDGTGSDRMSAPETAQLLATVPADTPYVFAQLTPVPEEYFKSYLAPIAGSMTDALEQFNTLLTSNAELADDLGLWYRLLLVLAEELKGKVSMEGMAELGINTRPRMVLYGLGLFPAMRAELADGAKFKAFLKRIAGKAGLSKPLTAGSGAEYWLAEISELQMSAVIAVVDNYVVAGLLPQKRLSTDLPKLLGVELPSESLASTKKLHRLADRYSAAHAVGFFDVVATAEMASNYMIPGQASCKEEFAELAGIMPRVVFTTTTTGLQSSGAFDIELRQDVARALRDSRVAVPGMTMENMKRAPLGVGIGLDLSGFAKYLDSALARVNSTPYKCEHLSSLAFIASMARGSLSGFLASPLAAVTGAMMFLNSKPDAANLNGALIVGTRDPGALIQAAAKELPPLAQKPIVPGQPPVSIDLGMDIVLSVATGVEAVGAAAGTGSGLLDLVNAKAPAEMPVLMLWGDGKFLAEIDADDGMAAVEMVAPELAKTMRDIQRKTSSSIAITFNATQGGLRGTYVTSLDR
jgi:hypothetical protein